MISKKIQRVHQRTVFFERFFGALDRFKNNTER